ncbi:M73 family metallopeptidase [Dietzia aurantiaca]|uniref:CalY family protein n=1 Tax=Dietzia aurantiaca TaxID=983873 RepID=UPI001E635E03|nr:CalY family protein [Dietzia aurantiaca]MCD2263904.1 M73 family metallopeptidase [Dietzia aurantiaca]
MTTPHRALSRTFRWRESGWTRVRATLALGMVFGLGAVGTLAQWSQTVTAQTGLFSTAEDTLDLTINGEDSEVSFGLRPNLGRGQSFAAMVNLENNGTVDLVYSVDLVTSELTTQFGTGSQARGNATSLRQAMTVSLYEGGGTDGQTCTGTLVLAQAAPATTVTTLLTGAQLPGETTDVYCIQSLVHADAPIESRMAQVGVTFGFNASIAQGAG